MTDHGVVAALRAAVASLAPVDERHARSTRIILAELNRLQRPLDEHADPVHVTGSAVVVGRRGTVLHRHKRLGLWLQPGGHIGPGETPSEAAVRETLEETGLACGHPPAGPLLIHADVHPGGRGHTHLDVRYLLHAPDDDPTPPLGESQEVAWFAWPTAIRMADPGLVGALRAIAAAEDR